MKKKIVTAIMAFSAAGILLAPFSAEAADIRIGKGYMIISNGLPEECFSWQELLDKWCPPETSAPDTENQTPEMNKPETETPDTEVQEPETGEPNETETESPETESPEMDATKSFAEQVVDFVNAERAKEGLSPLVLDESAAKAAYVRAKETEISFSHTRPDGRSFSTALTEQGMTFSGAGENIAWGQKSPEAVMEAWMNSPGHRANILNAKFTTIGVGYYQNSAGTNYWTQLFTY